MFCLKQFPDRYLVMKLLLLCLLTVLNMSAWAQGIDDEATSQIPEGQVLVSDGLSSETLSGMKIILGGQVAGIRESINTEASFEALDQQLLDLKQLSDIYIERLVALVPEKQQEILSNQKRLNQLLENLQNDFREATPLQIKASFNLINQTMEDYFYLNEQLFANLGIGPSPLNAQIPKDWNSPNIELEGFRDRYKLQSGEQILREIDDRIRSIRSASFKRFEDFHQPIIIELIELSKELRSRKSQLPVPSQEPFLNLCLQLEVIAENALFYLAENNRVAVRTQLQLALKTSDSARQYFQLLNEQSK
ncbi:MAG: hypothetical protein ACFCU1_08885 [Sumerlaeia bacterium]